MKDEHEKIKKQSYVSFFLSYCIYFYDIWLIHSLIDEIIQLGIITVYLFAHPRMRKWKIQWKRLLPYGKNVLNCVDDGGSQKWPKFL